MCGGWRASPNDYKPTPQPGDFVKAKICSKCGKRARRPSELELSRTVYEPSISIRTDEHGQVAWSKNKRVALHRSRVRRIRSCCSDKKNHVIVYGQVVRTKWSYYSYGAHKNFFLIVFVPSLGRRHWATLETVELVCANEYLINNVPEEDNDE